MQRTSTLRRPASGLGEAVVDYVIIISAIAIPFAASGTRAGIAALLVFLALAGPSYALRALTLSWLLTVLNPGIVGDGGSGAALRYVLVFVVFATAMFRGLWTTRGKVPRLVILSLAFPAYAAIAAVTVSYAVDVSLLKLFAYVVGVVGALWSVYLVENPERLKRWLLRMVVVIIFASLPLINSEVGYFRNGSGFQGILAHPQFYGAFLGVVLSWLFALRFIERDRSRLILATLVVGLISLAATEARVGAATLIGTAVFVSLFFAPSGVQRRRARNILLGGVTIILMIVLIFPAVGEAFYQFAIKEGRGNARDLAESLELSRGRLIAASFANFLEHPLTGIGFGLPSDPARLSVDRDPWLGLPLGAPVEKGFIFTAMLEETGVLGTILFSLFMISIIRRALWSRRASLIALAIAVPISNIAELTIFSLGGNGLLFWVYLAFAAYALPAAPAAEAERGEPGGGEAPIGPGVPDAARHGAGPRVADQGC